jgi:hypothetical protein
VLDWELCTLGDPLADLGLLQVYWAEPGDQTLPLGTAPTVMPGFPGRAAVAEAYASRSGRDLSTWTPTWPSPPGSWRSSSRAWSPATREGPMATETTPGAGSPRWATGP